MQGDGFNPGLNLQAQSSPNAGGLPCASGLLLLRVLGRGGCPTPRTPLAPQSKKKPRRPWGEGVAGALTTNCTGPGAGSLRLSPVKSVFSEAAKESRKRFEGYWVIRFQNSDAEEKKALKKIEGL